MTIDDFTIDEKKLTESLELLKLPLNLLQEKASQIRDEFYLNKITFSPKVFIPLTELCRDKCGYCTFAKPPAKLDSPYLDESQVLEIAKLGEDSGCLEALFTLGEKPELRYPVARTWLKDRGFTSTIEYLYHCSQLVSEKTSLLCHLNPGALSLEELMRLRQASLSQGMMLESVQEDLVCHFGSPDKTPQRRIETLISAGQLDIPFTTGILVGIGESVESIVKSLVVISQIHNSFGHIQEVIVQNFLPKSGTKMHKSSPCDPTEHQKAIALARIILPAEISVQAPPNLVDSVEILIRSGINDLGGISPVTIDHVNPEKPWPNVAVLGEQLNELGFELIPRLTVYPKFIMDKDRFVDKTFHAKLIATTDSSNLARNSNWCPGSDLTPPDLTKTSIIKTRTQIDEILEGVEQQQELSLQQIEILFNARGSEVVKIMNYADLMRQNLVGDEITFVKNRNINYTNICTFKCRFCAFSKGPLSLNLRGDPYLLDLDELAKRAREAYEMGATEVCLQGGIHPNFDGSYYLDVLNSIHNEVPQLHIHAFSALEVFEGARRSDTDLKTYLTMLKDAGLKSLPGTAAEILDDDIRKILCPDKINTEQWLEVHETAHRIGLTSNVTIMFGAIETYRSWAKHLLLTKQLAHKTKGFLEFVPLPFVHMASPIFLKGLSRKGPTFRETILMHSIGRIVYGTDIVNIQTSWVKLGTVGIIQALRAGCNDIGGTLIDENISRAAGANHGQKMDEDEFKAIADQLGRSLVQRNTKYQKLATV